KGEPQHAALGGGISRLPDLAVLRGDGSRVDDDAAPTVGRDGIEPGHGRRAFGDHRIGADEIDLDGAAERGYVMGNEFSRLALLRDRATARRDPGAVDEDALHAV